MSVLVCNADEPVGPETPVHVLSLGLKNGSELKLSIRLFGSSRFRLPATTSLLTRNLGIFFVNRLFCR